MKAQDFRLSPSSERYVEMAHYWHEFISAGGRGLMPKDLSSCVTPGTAVLPRALKDSMLTCQGTN